MTIEKFNLIKEIIETAFFSNTNLIQAKNKDGRLTSANSEDNVISFLKTLFNENNIDAIIQDAPAPRWWYDCLIIFDNGEKIPVNVKITEGNQADNVSSKKGMFYALTGLWPENIKGLNQWASFNEILLKNYNPNLDTDYYFIIYFKDNETFLFTSLKHIETLVPNGNNLPFQCKWKDADIYTSRSIKEQSYYILNTFIDSFIKKQSGLDVLLKWRNENE